MIKPRREPENNHAEFIKGFPPEYKKVVVNIRTKTL